MYNNLTDNFSFSESEKEILEFWKNDDTFQKSIDAKSEDKVYTFYEGPPTANGLPGIHHVIARMIKDVICRYKTMQGFKVKRKAGWDTHGLPVEIEVEKTLGFKSKSDIIEFGVEDFNKECKKSIFKYLKEWELLTDRMGYWINLEDAYVTFHNEYIESVWWALKKFFDLNSMYRAFKILPYCPKCESPLSSHEVAQGYVETKEPSIYVKFKIKSGKHEGIDFLVWTTTPWTLPSNVALAVHPESDYVKIELDKGDLLILAKDRLSVIKEEYKILESFTGNTLELIEYEPLFDFFKFEEKCYYVTLGNFVTMEDGTGIVHIAPAFGEDDFNIGKKYNLPLLQAVKKDGNFKNEAGNFAGKNFKEADPIIIIDLKTSGRLYKKEMYEHNYPNCWRHHTPLMYYAIETWFIKTTSFKDKMIELNNSINWNPEEFGTGRFGNWLDENKDWALSRNRFWGTPLPIWYYTDENENLSFECIGSIEELKSKAINFDEVYKDEKSIDLHKPYIDNIKLLSKTGKEMVRVPEVIDCWFDSGSMPFAQFHYPFENKELFENNYPSDFIAEGLDQTRGWFYTMHAIGTFLFGKPAYKNLIVNGLILDKEGKKMSKSKGNVVNPFDMLQKYGADTLRMYLAYPLPVWRSKNFNEDELRDLQNKFFDTLVNTYKFFVIYSNLIGFEYNKNIVEVENRSEIDKWILSKLNSTKKAYFESLDNYDITKATKNLYEFLIDELSNWYIRRNRKRFRNPSDENDKYSAYSTLYEILYEFLKLNAPVAPFISENIFMKLTGENKSIHLTEFTKANEILIDKSLEEDMELAQKLVYLIRSIRVKNNLKVRQPLRQVLVPVLNEEMKKRILRIQNIVLEEVNIKELNIIEGNSPIITKKAKPNFKSIGPKYGKDVKKVQKLIMELTNSDIIKLEANGTILKDEFNITLDDLEILTENIEGWIVDKLENLTVALDTKLDNVLIEEGIIREFINRIQNYRKNMNFDVNDKIKIFLKSDNELFTVINTNFEYIRREIFCDCIEMFNGQKGELFLTDINGNKFEFLLEKIA